ncbi:hypothetical protein Q1695_001303 [Nippostrongylus brasiliensis]|nr:hypothetical protein Q1695_001303 [Nippostrongylus brasiliensis]
METDLPFIPGNFYAKPFPFLVVDDNIQFADKNVIDRTYPDYRLLLTLDVLIPLVGYSLAWYSLYLMVSIYCWTSYKEGFRRRRLINNTISGTHAAVIGLFLLVYTCRNARLMFGSPQHYFSFLEMQIVLLSTGYFIYDSIDMVVHDTVNVSSTVMMIHHIVSVSFLLIVIASHKFLLYTYWALLMEVLTIFLNIRSVLNQSKLSSTSMIELYRVVSYINIILFIPFRFCIQAYLIAWTIVNYHNMSTFYFLMSLVCNLCFLLTNVPLFLRVLHSDGFLCWQVSKEQLGMFGENVEYEEIERGEHCEAEKPFIP